MDDRDEHSRIVAVCDDCGSIYAALELPSGEIQPIGHRIGCPCGSESFSKLDPGLVFGDDGTESAADD